MDIGTITRKQEISSVSDLMTWAEHLEQLTKTQGPMLFRGQPSKFQNLEPSFARAAKNSDNPVHYQVITMLEKRLLQSFQEHCKDVFEATPSHPMPTSKVEYVSLMQHYEVPTRFLDWSACIWTAAFFSCVSHLDDDGELWFFEESLIDLTGEDMPRSEILKKLEKSIGSAQPEYHPILEMPYFTLVEPAKNERIQAQKGKLTASVHASFNHADALWRLANHRHGQSKVGESFGRFIIKAESKPKILIFLKENLKIDAKKLFPDVVGLQRYLRWEFESLKAQLL